jgi:hypothetical protein
LEEVGEVENDAEERKEIETGEVAVYWRRCLQEQRSK